MGGAASTVSSVFGDNQNAGVLGTGQFKGEAYDYDKKAFDTRKDSDAMRKSFNSQLKAVNNRAAPQINMNPQEQFRGAQTGLVNQLQAQSLGQGPSLAQAQLRQATDRNIAQQMAMAASGRGRTAGAGMRAAQMGAAVANQQAAAQSAQARMQEQLSAQQALAGVASDARGADIGLATSQANLSLQNQAQKDALAQFYNSQILGLNQFDQNNLMKLEELRGGAQAGLQQVNAGAYNAASQNRANMMGGLGAAAVMMSDEDKKKDIKDTDKDGSLGSFLTKAGKAISDQAKAKKDVTGSEATAHGKLGASFGALLGKAFAAKGGAPGLDAPAPALGFASPMGLAAGPELPAFAPAMMGPALPAAAPMLAAASDEKGKKNVSADGDKLKEFVGKLKAYEYNYKDPSLPGAGEGKFVSPMAQDIEKSEIGKGLVEDTPNGKMVNYGKAGGVMLATAAMLNERMNELESIFKKKKKAE